MFEKLAKNILIEVADDCYISSIGNKENKEELQSIAERLSTIANKLVEGDVLAMNEDH